MNNEANIQNESKENINFSLSKKAKDNKKVSVQNENNQDFNIENSEVFEAERIKKKRKMEVEIMIKDLYKILDYNLEDFHSSMWNDTLKNVLEKFIEENEKIFLWIELNEINFLADILPEKENLKNPENYEKIKLLYIAKKKKEIYLRPDTLKNEIVSKTIDFSKKITNIIEDISANLVPTILKDERWPENIKKELLLATHKFLANSTEIKSKREEKTILYIPNEQLEEYIKNLNVNIPKHKDLVQRLEFIIVHWAKQIKGVLNSQTNQNDTDSSGPIEEINFWRNCKKNLVNIKYQLRNPKVIKILEILKKANSTQLKNLDKITMNIEKGAVQAEDNLKYLKIFEIPCKKLLELNSKEIPTILNDVFFSIRMLWEKCKYYSSEERIANLFRKVSNEIIKRCSLTINLDDLFKGNVEKCLEELEYSRKCGKKWKRVYEDNIKFMNKTKCWKFEADSVFAQIEAFVQRCNDLKEICEGQIQFARKGKEKEMPYFSGSKNSEIIFILDEIKDSFVKILNKLKDSNENKILDIKSTKWHDDYNVFKLGMKNLDNMYMNLVNFAFDHISTVEQGIEYMVAFKILSKRETIKMHVDKKIEKVNSLMLRELKAAENFAKVKPNPRFYSGNYSGKALWYKNLLSRVKRIKFLFDKLIWIKSPLKEQIESEYQRVENYLKILMIKCFKDFKEKNKDINDTLNKRLNTKILIEADDHRNKSIVPKSTHPAILQSRENSKGYIECNFDKVLSSFIIELSNFQQLGKYGIPNFGGRAEEIANSQKEKLRIYRENVMLVVRDYNSILNLMNEFEKGLFSDHLDKINNSIVRGIKTLRWSSQGTLDNFVKECRSKCQFLEKKIMNFKNAKKSIETKIKSISEKIRFIDFDSRKVHELGTFLFKQERTREKAKTQIEKVFLEIEEILTKIYDNFINKSLKIQEFWFKFVKNFDYMLEDEFKNTGRLSLQELVKAISGDKKTNTNPTQIFKIYISI